jgi:DNA-binding response OmpR family regulator
MSTPQRQRLLIIDDDRKLCRLIGEYLEPMGYEVAAVHTGQEGVETALGEPWQAVILDVMHPSSPGSITSKINACPGSPSAVSTPSWPVCTAVTS